MHSQNLQAYSRIPIHNHSGKNYLRYVSLIVLIGVSMLAFGSLWLYGLVFFPALLSGLFGLLCIRFPRLIVYDDGFVIEKRGLLSKFNDFDSFNYRDIKTVDFSPGFTDRNYLIVLALLGSGGYGGNSKADQMIIHTNDDQIKVFNRFGGRHDFIAAIDEIKKRICPAVSKM